MSYFVTRKPIPPDPRLETLEASVNALKATPEHVQRELLRAGGVVFGQDLMSELDREEMLHLLNHGIDDMGLNLNQDLVYSHLVTLAYGDETAHGGCKKIAAECSMGNGSAYVALCALENRGLISRTPRMSEVGRYTDLITLRAHA